MSRINRDIYTSIDVNGPYIRIDTQPTSTTLTHNGDATFTIAASTYYLTGDEADIGNIDTLETDAVAPTSTTLDNQTPGVPHTAKDDGTISYQWYEISVDPVDQSETLNKLTDNSLYSGTTTTTLTVKSVLSPGYHLNRYYCDLDYIPNLTNGQNDTGNAVNDIVKSDEATLNVRPFIIIDTQPVSISTRINQTGGSVFTTARLSDTRFPWNDYRLQYQWWEKDKLNEGSVPNIRLVDGDFTETFTQYREEETLVDKIQHTTRDFSVTGADIVNSVVGIPTEAVEVSVKIFGGSGGTGGDEDGTYTGGAGGKGRVGEFKFSASEIDLINNASGPTSYLLTAGSGGDDGTTGTTASGGLGGFSYAESSISIDNNSITGGSGGDAGPGGSSGSGGGGGAGSGLIRFTNVNGTDNGQWLAIAGGAGGGGGASRGASGGAGSDAGEWDDFDSGLDLSATKAATVVNYNPIAGTEQASYSQDDIDYGFYVKTSSQTSSLDTTTTYDRIVVVWNNRYVINLSNAKILSDSVGLYVESGNVRYYASTHRGSLLGWCDDDSQDEICIRGNGGYVNSFDVFKQGQDTIVTLLGRDGGTGEDKIIGDGGGGGGAGGGARSLTIGGSVGTDPTPDTEVTLTFKVINNVSNSILNGKYIKFIENSWYGFPETEPARGKVITINKDRLSAPSFNVTLKPNTTYDVVSNFEAGRTSDSLRILQDLTATENAIFNDAIVGRSVGMNADRDDGTDEVSFRDFVVAVSDGSFDYSPETVRLETGEIVGRAIIKFTTPAAVKNAVKSTGGEGGRSEYNSQVLDLVTNGNYGLNGSRHGRVDLTYKTEQPYNIIDTVTRPTSVIAEYSVRGSSALEPSPYTSTLTIKSNYVFSKRVLCQITAWNLSTNSPALTSGPNTVYTDTVDFTFTDEADKTITIEQIRHNDDFAVLSNVNLTNGDLTFEKSNLEGEKEVEYYSFYSNDDIEVDVKMYGGKGNDVGSFSGGEGGFSYLRLNMKKDTEYVIAGLNDFVNAPFLFKRSRLLACVGGGGDANTLGPGGAGGGVEINGGTPSRGGVGGISPSTLAENGVLGSASIGSIFPNSGDTQASIPNGGTTVRCSKGNPIPGGPSPCTDRSGNTKFKLSDLTDVTNTREISRGFKAGYNVFYTAGRNNGAIINKGWGGSGATGGAGSDEYGGGGGSGYIVPGLTTDIFARSEEQSNQDGTDPITSTLGGSTGPARVVISLAEIPSSALPGFIERPAEPSTIVVDVDTVRVPDFEPLPELVSPPLVNPPVPSMSITSMVSTGFSAGNRTFTAPYESSIDVLEKGQLNVNVKTQNIPSGTTYYWKVKRNTTQSLFTDDDFNAVTGSFTTSTVGSEVVGSFTINPKEDNQTDFIGGTQNWTFSVYTDRLYQYEILNTIPFNILDTSLSAPVATFPSLIEDTTTGPKIYNTLDEASTITVDVATENIKNGDLIYWSIINNTTQDADFSTPLSGSATVSSGFTLNADGVATNISSNLSTAHRGTTSFLIGATEDQTTEGPQNFGLQIEYPSGTVITRTTGTIVGEVKKSIRINDVSIDPEATFTADATVNEGSTLSVTVNTNYLKTNDTIYWKLWQSGGTVAATTADFEAVTGSFKVTEISGSTAPVRQATGSVDIKPKNDTSTEGTENFELRVYRDSGYTDPLHVPSTTDAAFHAFSVIDTSLDPVSFASIVPEEFDEDSEGVDFTFQTRNLIRDTVVGTERDTFYWRIYEYDSGGVHALGTEKTTSDGYIKDFTEHEGNFKVEYKEDETGSVPVHEKKFTIIAEEDNLDDGDKEYEIRFFATKAEFDKPGNDGTTVHTSIKFTVKDTSKTQYTLNTANGYGVPSDTTPDGYSSFNQPSPYKNQPVIDEESMHSFRLETTAQPGTRIYYQFADQTTKSTDWDFIPTSDLPTRFQNSEEYDIKDSVSESDLNEGYVDTMEIKDEYTQLSGARSVAFIYIQPEADRSPRFGQEGNEGTEKFTLLIKNIDGEEVLTQTDIRLLDSSIKDEQPKIKMVLTGTTDDAKSKFSKIDGGGADDSFITYKVESDTADLRIDWTLSGGAPTNGSLSGTGWSSTYEYTAPKPKKNTSTEPWYLTTTANQTNTFKSPPNSDPEEAKNLEFTMTVTNEDGDQESEYTLNLQVVKKKTTWTTYPLFRYYRVNLRAYRVGVFTYDPVTQTDREQHALIGITRYAITNYGPDFPDRNQIGSWSESKKQDWGKDFYDEVEERSGGAGGSVGTFTFWDGTTEQTRNSTFTPWTLEGITTFAFRTGDPNDPSPPKDTASYRQMTFGDSLRDYFAWPDSNYDYWIFNKSSMDQTLVPSNVYQPLRTLAVGVQQPYNAKQYRLGEKIKSDGTVSTDTHPDYNITSTKRTVYRGDPNYPFEFEQPAYNPPSPFTINEWAPVNEGTFSWAE